LLQAIAALGMSGQSGYASEPADRSAQTSSSAFLRKRPAGAMGKSCDQEKVKREDLIRSVDLKLARADAQVRTLADQVSAWTARNPITARCELRDGRLGFRLIVQDFAETAPLDDWGLLVGECVHNLRSALDNLAFALARLRQDPPSNPAAIHFPICQDKSMFDRVRKSLGQMPAEAASLIELFQPFQRNRSDVEGTPEKDALVLLQRLNNTDKHRVPSVVLIAPTEIHHSCAAQFYSDEDAQANVPPDVKVWVDVLQPGVVLLEQKTNRPIDKVTGSFHVEAIVAIQTIHKRAPVVEVLSKLRDYTALVVAKFRGFYR
jgi:hypothetical protein